MIWGRAWSFPALAAEDGDDEVAALFGELAAEADGVGAFEFDDGEVAVVLLPFGESNFHRADLAPAEAAVPTQRAHAEEDGALVAGAADGKFAENGHESDGYQDQGTDEE